jgi:GNAT superfamily N-acetyltransferase
VDKESYYGIVARSVDTKDLIGFGLYYLGPYFFSSKQSVYDMVTYVVPSWRGSSLGRRLISHAERWGKDKGAIEVILGTTTKVDTAMVEKFYEAIGYDRVGSVYKLRIK